MARYNADVIIVGAGPAGATAARLLGSWGVEVLLIERCRMPRYKPCGGAITRRTIQALAPLDVSPVIETWVRKLVVQSPSGESFVTNLPEGIIATVMRDKFDTFLLDASILAGAKLKSEEPVLRCEQKPDGIEVMTARRTYRCLVLIGADGANSVVAKGLGFKPKIRTVSVVAELLPKAKERWDESIHLYFPFAFNGYAWCFPKSDHLSAGLYTRSSKIPDWQKWLSHYLENLGVREFLDRQKVRGHLIPIAGKNSVFHKGNAIVVGDAAGVADPFTGEGISWAIHSGRIAAAFVRAYLEGESGALSDYTRAVREEILSETAAAHCFARILFTFPQFSFRHFLHRERILNNFTKLLGGEVTYRELLRKALRKGLVAFLTRS